MKAWILSDRTGDCEYSSLVFAETPGQAKMQANQSNGTLYQSELEIDDWINISANRAKIFDDMEGKSEKEICIKLIKEYGFWFEVDYVRYNEDNINEFKKLWNGEMEA